MPGKTAEKVECLNPNTGGKMRIDAGIYENFSKAIYHTLKQNKNPITYTEIVKGVKECFKENKTKFNGSIEWYRLLSSTTWWPIILLKRGWKKEQDGTS